MNAHVTQADKKQLLEMLKALADENRLVLLQLLSDQEIAVGDLAERVGISEPTVSHHLSKLRETGLVTLRMDGNKRYYRANTDGVRKFKQLASTIDQPAQPEETPQPDNSWIAALGWPEADQEVLRAYTKNGKLVQIPPLNKKRQSFLLILRWLSTLFEPDRMYTEPEVNAVIRKVNDDPAGLRRDLVDWGFLRRERGGGKYWLAPEGEVISANE